MAQTIITTIGSGIAGQTVRATLLSDMAPVVPIDTSKLRMSLEGVLADWTTEQIVRVDSINHASEAHLLKMNAAIYGDGGFEYTVHPTQQLVKSDASLIADVNTFEFAINLYSIANPSIMPLQIRIRPFTIEIYDYSALKAIYTATFPGVVSGTRIRLDLSTRVFTRLYIDDVFITNITIPSAYPLPWGLSYSTHGKTTSSTLTYPVGHPAHALYPLGPPLFSEIQLTGAWRPSFEPYQFYAEARSAGAWLADIAASAHAVDSAGNPYADFLIPATVGATILRIKSIQHSFGAYTALGVPPAPEFATKDVTITGGTTAALAVSGPNPVTIEPGATYRVTANYPSNQLTFAAVGSGSFGSGADVNLYTAPTDAGTYTFTVTRGAEVVTITVNVPVRITPVTASLIGGGTQAFTVNANVTTPASQWVVTGGTLSSQATRSATYTAPASTGNYEIRATTVLGLATTPIAVTASGSVPTAGLRISPQTIAAMRNDTVQVSMIGDVAPAIWATINNVRIDGATNNLFILSNSAVAEAAIAQANGSSGGTLTWNFNSTNVLDTIDSCTFEWVIKNSGGQTAATLSFEYLGSGQQFNITLRIGGVQIAQNLVTMTPSGGLQIVALTQNTFDFKYRAVSTDAYTTLASGETVQDARFHSIRYLPSLPSRANNTVILAAPTLTGTWGRWLPPTWQAELINAQGQVIGALPISASESPFIVSGQKAALVSVSCTTVGTARVRAVYPSGASAVNECTITISDSTNPPLAVTAPVSPVTLDPGEPVTVSINASTATVSFIAGPGGSFGTTVPTRNVYTAGPKAGNYFFDVIRGTETVRIQVIIRSKPSIAAFSVVALGQFTLGVNYDSGITVGTSGGTASLGAPSGGSTPIIYTAPGTAGSYNLFISTPFGNSTVPITVTAISLPPIDITTAAALVEPSATKQIATNYPAAEVAFSATGGSISTAGLWTAPATAGFYTITASRPGASSDTVVMTVPLRITPANPPATVSGGQIQFAFNYSPLSDLRQSSIGGSITPGGLWTAGTTAGSATVTAQAIIGGSTFTQTAVVQVLVNALNLNVPGSVTLNPGETLRITSQNYPVGSLTFAAVRGSFGSGGDVNLYTAPADAGPDTITVTSGSQSVVIAVTVRLTIAPASTTIAAGVPQTITMNADVTVWSSPGGLVLTSSALRTTVATGSVAGIYFVTGTTALGFLTATINVTGAVAPALTITQVDPTQVEPGGTIDILANYPVAEITYSATGGTFDALQRNRYRAPATAGSYVITLTRGIETDTITINVPFRVTPGAVVLEPGGKTQFSANHPAPSWGQQTGVGIITFYGEFTASFNAGVYPQGVYATAPGGLGPVYSQVTIQSIVFQVYAPDRITLEPGAGFLVSANVPGRSLQYSPFGGSFGTGSDYNVYYAPAAAGDFYFIVSYLGQQKRVDVHVPLRITPKSIELQAGQTFQFQANSGGVNWSLSGSGNLGTISNLGFYQAPVSGGAIVVVTASTASDSDTATIFFLSLFPYQPNYTVSGDVSREAVSVKSESGRRSSRVHGEPLRSFELRFEDRDKPEFIAARLFFMDRFPDLGFLINDKVTDEFIGVVFDSKFQFEFVSASCGFNYGFRCTEIES